MSKRLEKLADKMIRLTPEEQQKLQLIIKAKLLPEIAKQQQQGYYNKLITHKCQLWVSDQVEICLCRLQEWLHNKDY